ncbi:MAG: exodeoxyribonuclease VII small subunit [Gammaproteobacteria bacterium]|jgi:exodeoxyribonuclease VII small subunit
MARKKETDINLEQALGELEALVEEMESGDLSLEAAMKKFERGIALTRNCQAALRDAEQKVEILLEKSDGDAASQPFEPDD